MSRLSGIRYEPPTLKRSRALIIRSCSYSRELIALSFFLSESCCNDSFLSSMAFRLSSSDIFSLPLILSSNFFKVSLLRSSSASYFLFCLSSFALNSVSYCALISSTACFGSLPLAIVLMTLLISFAFIGLRRTSISTFSTYAFWANGLSPVGSLPSEDTALARVVALRGSEVIFRSFVPESSRYLIRLLYLSITSS